MRQEKNKAKGQDRLGWGRENARRAIEQVRLGWGKAGVEIFIPWKGSSLGVPDDFGST